MTIGERWAMIAGAAFLVAACTTEPGCDICTSSALVYGRATTSDGTPVPDVIVLGHLVMPDCTGRSLASIAQGALTDVNGYYRLTITHSVSTGPHCATIQFAPASGSDLQARTDTVPALHFRLDPVRSGRLDSTRVDATLAATMAATP